MLHTYIDLASQLNRTLTKKYLSLSLWIKTNLSNIKKENKEIQSKKSINAKFLRSDRAANNRIGEYLAEYKNWGASNKFEAEKGGSPV